MSNWNEIFPWLRMNLAKTCGPHMYYSLGLHNTNHLFMSTARDVRLRWKSDEPIVSTTCGLRQIQAQLRGFEGVVVFLVGDSECVGCFGRHVTTPLPLYPPSNNPLHKGTFMSLEVTNYKLVTSIDVTSLQLVTYTIIIFTN